MKKQFVVDKNGCYVRATEKTIEEANRNYEQLTRIFEMPNFENIVLYENLEQY